MSTRTGPEGSTSAATIEPSEERPTDPSGFPPVCERLSRTIDNRVARRGIEPVPLWPATMEPDAGTIVLAPGMEAHPLSPGEKGV